MLQKTREFCTTPECFSGMNLWTMGSSLWKGSKWDFTGKVAPSGERLKRDQSIFVVQSVSTGELFANKLIEAAWDPTTLLSLPPLELRVSTYRHAIGDPNIDIPGINGNDSHRKGVLPNVPYFNKLRFWQELDPQDPTSPNCTVYSLFYE